MIATFALLVLCGGTCLAAGEAKIMELQDQNEVPSVYVKGIEDDITSASAVIGNVECPDVTFTPIAEEEVSVRTLFLVDNSLSIPENSRDFVKSVILQTIAGRSDNEEFAVATFGEEMTMVMDFSDDYAALKDAVDGIGFVDQETYLTDVLYSLIADQHFNEDDNLSYRRIVVISDGVDNKSIGITGEELSSLLEEEHIPVYTLGVYNKRQTNAAELESMFALARQTSADAFLLDEVESEMDIVNALAEDRNIVRFDVVPLSEVKDGSKKTLTLNIRTVAGELSLELADVKMPQEVKTAVTDSQEKREEAEPDTTTEEDATVEPENAEEKSNTTTIVLICVIVVLAIIILIVIILLAVKMAKQKKEENEFKEVEYVEPVIEEPENTYNINDRRKARAVQDDGEESTQMLWDDFYGEGAGLVRARERDISVTLTDIDSPARSFTKSITDRLVIGRSKNRTDICIEYAPSVSSVHCAIEFRAGKFYLIDLQSSNGTFINGSRVLSEIEITSGCIMVLGNVKLRVEMK